MNEPAFLIVPGAEAAQRPWQIVLAVTGPSGGGKSLSALLLGSGIRSVVGGALGALDTESGRMSRYLKDHRVDWYLELAPPFSSLRYLDAIRAIAAKGCKTIIVDSLSHEHEGAGGHLEQHENNVTRMAGENATYQRREAVKFAAWIEPKQHRNKLIQGLLQMPVNFIFCFRAKEKMSLEKEDGKVKPRSLGWQPIAGEEFVFEATALAVLPPRANGVPDWSALAAKIEGHHKSAWPPGQAITEETGAAMARFAAAPAVPDDPEADPVYRAASVAAKAGRKALTEHWQSLSKPARTAFKPYADALGKIADAADVLATVEPDMSEDANVSG